MSVGSSGSRSGEFGDPSRRATDILLVSNALMFGLQALSKQALTMWGAKVRARPGIVA
jgi:hypothetical protein